MQPEIHGAESRRRRLLLFGCALIQFAQLSYGAPLGLPPVVEQTDENSRALQQTGQALFSDKRLSVDGRVSCASCHIPEHHFTDEHPTARVQGRQPLTRRTPSLLNVRYDTKLFWDGRATALEAQARVPLLDSQEHGLANEEAVAQVVRSDLSYAASLSRLMHVDEGQISIREITAALAAFEKTLVAGNSPVDRYLYAGDSQALSPAAIRGLTLFRGRARCVTCHVIGDRSALFTDDAFHDSPLTLPKTTLAKLGSLTQTVMKLRTQENSDALNALITSDLDIAALGRFVVTLDPKDIGLFKTPSLRNVALVAPYMHDGSVATLSQAIELELYSRTAQNYPLVLTEDEQLDLLAFLQALNST